MIIVKHVTDWVIKIGYKIQLIDEDSAIYSYIIEELE